MKNRIIVFFAVVFGMVLVIGDLQPVYSQETEEDEFILEDIVVTATKREQALQDVPVAITVVGQEQMERQQIYTLQDLSRVTAGLEFGDTGGAPGGAAIILGIGTTGLSGVQMEPSVGVVVDGVPQGRVNVGNIFDLERVEVLRGPQGTLFGNTASAGVINIITAAPDPSQFMGKFCVDATFDGKLGSEFGRQ